MFRDLAPLYVYMRRYRWGYLWGTLSCISANAVWVLFPRSSSEPLTRWGVGSAAKEFCSSPDF